MNTKKTVIAASIAALLAAPVAAFAKDQWEYHEDQWGNVTSYGNVPLAQDSSEAWGPWAEFIMPAAGGPVINPVQFVGEGGGERYRPLPQIPEPPVPPVVDACAAGAWCGYAVYNNSSYSPWGSDGGEGTAKLALFLKPDDPSVTPGSGVSEGTVEFNLSHLHGAEPFQTTTGVLPAEFGWFSDEGMHDFNANPDNYYATGAEGYPHNWWYSDLATSNDEVAVGWFRIQQYISGSDVDERYTRGYYVAGIQTPQAYLNGPGKVDGVGYYGGSVDAGGSTIPVTMTVNFASGTWSGSWNGGQDGSTYTSTLAGTEYVNGHVGFNASGTITGAHLQSTSVSALDGTVTGSVNSTVFGQEAGSIGGAHHIVKSTESYTSATNVGVHLLDKGNPD